MQVGPQNVRWEHPAAKSDEKWCKATNFRAETQAGCGGLGCALRRFEAGAGPCSRAASKLPCLACAAARRLDLRGGEGSRLGRAAICDKNMLRLD